jgi:charged multivesicular body protein 5
MDDIMMDQEEIQEVMGRAFGNMDDVDEDDLMEELDGLEDELEMEDELGVATDVPSYLVDEMPGAPSAAINAPAAPAAQQLDEFGLPMAPMPASSGL